MKKTKFLRVLTLLMALCLVSLLFVGCEKTDNDDTDSSTPTTAESSTEASSQNVKGYCKVVLGDTNKTEYEVNLDLVKIDNGLFSVLDHLKTTKGLTYACDASGFLTEVGGVKQDTTAGVYVYLFTSVAKDQDVSQYKSTQTYGDMTLVSAGVGAKDMTIENGAVIYIGTISW
jgi:hypothetical protein